MTRNAIAAAVSLELKPCECGRFTVVSPDGTRTKVPCGGITKRTFAPGHDARLKGVLIRAAFAGHKLERVGLAGNEVRDALAWADFFNFGYLVRAGVELAREKAAAKKAKKAAKVAKAEANGEVANPVVEVAAPVIVKAKVGRWVYEGEVLECGDGSPCFRYTDKQGNTKDAVKFDLI